MKTVTTSVGFQDPLGNLVLSGNLVLTLSQAAEVTSGGGLIAPKVVVLPLNATTAKIASTQIYFSDELSPTGTTYHAELLDSGGNIIADFGQWSITGASADLSTMVPVTSATVSLPGVVLTAPAAAQHISGTFDLTVPSLNGVIVVDGTQYAKTSTGINAAITAVAAGGTVYLPAGTYVVNSQILIAKSLNLIGAGATGGTVLQVAASLGATTDVILVQPAAAGTVIVRFQDFRVVPASGTPGRHAIHLDGTNGLISNSIFDHLDLEGLNTIGNAIFSDGSGNANGTPATTIIRDCTLVNGINLSNSGDTNVIDHNAISSFSGNTKPGIEASFISGAASLIITKNNISSVGGAIHLGTNVYAAVISENEMETTASFTGSNSSLVDIDGTGGSHASNVVIGPGNSFQVVNGITANGLRLNFADRAQVFGNVFERGATTSKDILITANAVQPAIGTNAWNNGSPLSAMISDAAGATGYSFNWQGQFFSSFGSAANPGYSFTNTNNTGFWSPGAGIMDFTAAGNDTILYAGALERHGAANVLGWSSLNAPNLATSDVNISRNAAGVLQVGTGETANALGKIQAAVFLPSANTSQKTESAADTNVLTFTPAAVAGSYRVRFTMAVSAQNTATLGWTATWKDSNGQAQAPTNLSLFTSGTAAPALTVTAATNGVYYGEAMIDTDNSATAIVVKLTFTGTSFAAKVSATIERLI